ncbi:MAG: hypothetical protein ABIO05_04635 [Ferruginibacter sp.]
MKTKDSIRPLTSQMITKLKECKEMEEKDIPCLPKHFSASLSGLYKRKFIDVRRKLIDDRDVMCVFTTQAGLDHLKLLEETHLTGLK